MKITPILTSQEIPSVGLTRVPPEAFTGVARGLAGLGAGLGQAAEDWAGVSRLEQQIEEKKRKHDLALWTTSKVTQLKDAADNLHREIEKIPAENHDQILKRWEKEQRIIEGKFAAEALAKGGDYYELYKKESEIEWTKARIKAKEVLDLKWKDAKVAQMNAIQNRLEEDAAKALVEGKDPKPALEFYDALMVNAKNDGIISSVDLEKRRETLSDRINKNIKTLRDEIRRQEEKQVETRVYTLLKAEHGSDYDKILERLDDAVYLNTHGLTVEKASNLKNIVKNEKARVEEERKVRQEKTAGDLYIRFQQNQLTFEDIDREWRKGNLKKEDVRALGVSLRQHIERKETQRKTDPNVYTRLLEMVYDPDVDRQTATKNVLSSLASLSVSDADSLMRKIEERAESADLKYYKKALEVFKGQIVPKRGQLSAILVTPQEELDYYQATLAFDKLLQARRAAGKPLVGREILEEAIRVAPTYRKTMYERIEGLSREMKEELGKTPPRKQGQAAPTGPGAPAAMTDAQIKRLLEENGFEGTPENIKTFRRNNGL
jgi:hypothetical protein